MTAEYIENYVFDEIAIGASASLKRVLTEKDIQLFAVMSGDINPAHLDAEYAAGDIFHKIIGHGMWGGALISTVLGTMLPGPGTIYLGQNLRFKRPVGIGDEMTVTVTAREKNVEKHRIIFDCICINQLNETVIEGQAEVIAPTEKVRRLKAVLPEVILRRPRGFFQEYIEKAKAFGPMATGIVHPLSIEALDGALEASKAGLIKPVLIGPENKIRYLAQHAQRDISACEIIHVPHSHAAAEKAVELARAGKLAMLMKGSLHTDEFMHAVCAAPHGLTTDRRMTHAFVLDVPTYPKPLIISDAAINIDPDLITKRDIVQNAIDLAEALGVAKPKVAILAAIENVSPKMQSTIDAAALCKMADRGQITGGIIDGPLAFDNVISKKASRIKNIISPVTGEADILIAPNIEAGNMLVKQLEYLAESRLAGVVLGCQVPIVLTSRADDSEARRVSCALAILYARQQAEYLRKKQEKI